jgi:hypothetical protein
MSSAEVRRITDAIDKLEPDDRARVLNYLLRERRGPINKVNDIKHLYGSIKLTVDPMEFQEKIRDEWT